MLIALMILGLMLAVGLPVAAESREQRAESPEGDGGKFWRFVQNEAKSGQPTSATLYVYAGIMSDWWSAWGPDEVYPKMFADELEKLGAVDEIHLRINSPGGSVFAAQTIYNLLKQNSAKVITHIDGMAVSAASIVALAGDEIIMAGNAMMMIHAPMFSTSGDAEQLRADADLLDQVQDTIIAVYAEKTGKGKDELVAMMKAETWMTAAQAKELGFVDTIVAPVAVTNLVGSRCAVNGVEMDFSGMRVWPGALLASATEEAEEPSSEEAEEPSGDATDGTDGTDGSPEAEGSEEPAAEDQDPEGTPSETAATSEEAEPTDPVAIERKRVQDILDLQIVGSEEIVRNAIKDGTSAGDVAQAILKSPSVRNAGVLAARLQDAGNSNANGVSPSTTPMEPLSNVEQKAFADQIAAAANKGRE